MLQEFDEWLPVAYTGRALRLVDGTMASGSQVLMCRPTGLRKWLFWREFDYRKPTPEEECLFCKIEAW